MNKTEYIQQGTATNDLKDRILKDTSALHCCRLSAAAMSLGAGPASAKSLVQILRFVGTFLEISYLLDFDLYLGPTSS